MAANVVRVEALLPKKDVQAIDDFVDLGLYATRTDVIRSAIRSLIGVEDRKKNMDEAVAMMDRRLKELGVTPDEIMRDFENRDTGRKARELIERARSRKNRR